MTDTRVDKMLIIPVIGLTILGLILIASTSYVMAGENLGDKYFYMLSLRHQCFHSRKETDLLNPY